jgi:hypothetical protein
MAVWADDYNYRGLEEQWMVKLWRSRVTTVMPLSPRLGVLVSCIVLYRPFISKIGR